MTAATTPPALPSVILSALAEHFGHPALGGQHDSLAAAVAKVIGLAAQLQAQRQLWAARPDAPWYSTQSTARGAH